MQLKPGNCFAKVWAACLFYVALRALLEIRLAALGCAEAVQGALRGSLCPLWMENLEHGSMLRLCLVCMSCGTFITNNPSVLAGMCASFRVEIHEATSSRLT